jgi:Lrp/AsnC family transcriptional regulator, leucine-responsive regulatory protein
MKLDPYDKKILHELQANGRLSNVELAEKVGLSESPCLRRVRALEAGKLITGYHAMLDHHQLGLDITAYIQVNLDQRSEANTMAFEEAVTNEPLIIECYALSGNYDYLLKVTAADLDEFADLTMQRILRFPGVDNITSGLTLKVLKKYSGYPVS